MTSSEDLNSTKKRKSIYSWSEKVRYFNQKASLYIDQGNDGLINGYKNTQKAFAALIPLEKALYEQRKQSNQPNTINLSKADYEGLLFWVFYIEKGSARIHYVERLQKATNIPYKTILKRARELERVRENRKRTLKLKEDDING